MIKEIQEEPFQEQSLNKDSSKNVEPSKNDTNTENKVSKISSELNLLSLGSEVSKSPKTKKESKEIEDTTIISKDKEVEQKTKNEQEEPEFEINQQKVKKNLTLPSLSSLISNDIPQNQIKTPLRQDSAPFNFKQKTKVNFQEKSKIGANTGNDFQNHRNSNSMRSPIYSYFDESQRFLSEQYSEEKLLNLTRRNNETKTLSNKEIKNIKNSSNSEVKHYPQPKIKNSNSSINKEPKEDNEIETPNYNDFNLFNDNNMSPEYYNMSQISGGLNNLYGNKFPRKLSQATGSNIDGNSAIKQGNIETFGDNENNDINANLPTLNNENIGGEEYFNNYVNNKNNNEEILNKTQILNNRNIVENNNLL